ncbi:MAG: FG-GAP-like repeat-containing protein, partial [Actinobacteria bacterium]|nr:FG-GAP-like repeat-containing protein [Actinomycetota bacterium]
MGGGDFDVFLADLNGDGLLDVVSSVFGSFGGEDGVHVAVNLGSRRFANDVQITEVASDSLSAADLDADGIADVLSSFGGAFPSGSGELSVNFGTGNAAFAPPQLFTAGVAAGGEIAVADFDGDGALDACVADESGERIAVLFNRLTDRDGDGALDDDERVAGSNPGDADSDDDGLRDGFELANGFDPLLAGEASQDPDGDGLDNLAEQAAGSSGVRADTDFDRLDDAEEVALGSNPARRDTDFDGLLDGDEVEVYGTNPAAADTEGDGLSDYAEVKVHGTDPRSADTDGDGIGDADEVAIFGLDPLDPTDATEDPDQDGLINRDEVAAGSRIDVP